MMHQTPEPSTPEPSTPESSGRQLTDLLLALPEPDWRDWLDYRALGITPAHEDRLIEIATDPELLSSEGDVEEICLPLHACRCLAELRSERAVTPLLEVLETDTLSDAWLMRDLPTVFATIGPPAVEPLVAFSTDRSRDTWARANAVEALGQVARTHEPQRTACVDAMTRILEGFEHEDPAFNAIVIEELVELDAREAAPLMGAAFEAEHVELAHMGDWEDVQIELGLLEERRTPRPPLHGSTLSDPRPLPGWRSLDDARTEVLERVLSRHRRTGEGLSPRELEGFLFAVASAPDIVSPTAWVPLVTGGEEPAFEDEDETRAFVGTLLELYGLIQDGVNEAWFDPPDGLFLDDLMSNLEKDTEVARWSRGFINGHMWLEELWDVSGDLEPLVDQELGQQLFVLTFFTSPSVAQGYREELGREDVTLETLAALARGDFAHALMDYATLGRRVLQARLEEEHRRSSPATAEAKPARNEPCPCGSGRKYKKCCGRAKG